MLHWGARVDLGEHHVERDLHVADHVSICHLNVLNLRSKGLPLEGLDTDQLDFNGLDDKLGISRNDIPVEGLVEGAVGWIDETFKLEFRHSFSSTGRLKWVRADYESLWDIFSTNFRVNTCSADGAVELLRALKILAALVQCNRDLILNTIEWFDNLRPQRTQHRCKPRAITHSFRLLQEQIRMEWLEMCSPSLRQREWPSFS